MDLNSLRENVREYLGKNISIESPLMIDVNGNIFLSDRSFNNEFKVVINFNDIIEKLETEMTCTVGAPDIKFCDDASVQGKLVSVDDEYQLVDLSGLVLDFGRGEQLRII